MHKLKLLLRLFFSTSLLFQLGNLFFNFLSVLIGNNLFIQSISLIYRDTANLFLPGTGTFCLGLELLRLEPIQRAYSKASFNALSGLSCYCDIYVCIWHKKCFNALSGLYLISTYQIVHDRVAEADGCQCPLGLIPHFYVKAWKRWRLPLRVSMPSRAYTSFLQYPFKNLGFMRFPEPVFAGIYQNILTTAVFRAC